MGGFQDLFAISAIKRIDREGKTDYKSQLCPVNGTELRNRGQKSGTKWAVIFPLSAPCIKTSARHLAPALYPHRLGLRRRQATPVGDNHDHCVTYAYLTTYVTPISWLLRYIRLSHDYCVTCAYLMTIVLHAPSSWLLCYIRLPHDLSYDYLMTISCLSHDYCVTYAYLMTVVLNAPISWLCYVRLSHDIMLHTPTSRLMLHTPISWLFCYICLSQDYYVTYAYLKTYVTYAYVMTIMSHTPISWLLCCIRLPQDLCYVCLSHENYVTCTRRRSRKHNTGLVVLSLDTVWSATPRIHPRSNSECVCVFGGREGGRRGALDFI